MHFIVVCQQLQQMNRKELVLAVLLENHSTIYMAIAAKVGISNVGVLYIFTEWLRERGSRL
jgi:predicted ArsR family transcriptional regulator